MPEKKTEPRTVTFGITFEDNVHGWRLIDPVIPNRPVFHKKGDLMEHYGIGRSESVGKHQVVFGNKVDSYHTYRAYALKVPVVETVEEEPEEEETMDSLRKLHPENLKRVQVYNNVDACIFANDVYEATKRVFERDPELARQVRFFGKQQRGRGSKSLFIHCIVNHLWCIEFTFRQIYHHTGWSNDNVARYINLDDRHEPDLIPKGWMDKMYEIGTLIDEELKQKVYETVDGRKYYYQGLNGYAHPRFLKQDETIFQDTDLDIDIQDGRVDPFTHEYIPHDNRNPSDVHGHPDGMSTEVRG